jgi:GNAT superfamily N-acetyltransferase
MPYLIREVDGRDPDVAAVLHRLNGLAPDIFPALESRHLEDGFWWLAYLESDPVAFAGMVPFEPFPNIGYFKRCYVLPDHHGHGLQLRFMVTREIKAKKIGWTHLVSECAARNLHSSANFRRAGFEQAEPEQRWGQANSVYWVKAI